VTAARGRAAAIERAMRELRTISPGVGSYVSESDFFEEGRQRRPSTVRRRAP
jgi:hypothetical protein